MYVESSHTADVLAAVDTLPDAPGEALLLLLGQACEPDVEELVRGLNARGRAFFGGVFPGVLHQGRLSRRGALVISLPLASPVCWLPGMQMAQAKADLVSPVGDGDVTAIVLVDGLSEHVFPFLSDIYAHLADTVDYFGGGAGYYVGERPGRFSFEQRPCVFSTAGVAQDAAVIALVRRRSALSIQHGWSLLDGPFVATRTTGSVVHELNWRPAFDVYREVVEAHADCVLSRDQAFFDVSKRYPFGVVKGRGSDDVVVVAIEVTDDGSLICGAEVMENTVLNVMQGSRETLLAAAARASSQAVERITGAPREALVADCISRWLIHGEDFEREIMAVQSALTTAGLDLVVHGALTLGEIASHGRRFMEYLTQTVVVDVLHD